MICFFGEIKSVASNDLDSSTDFNAWFASVCDGDSASTTRLWAAYFDRIGASVANRLTSQGRHYEDHEDVAAYCEPFFDGHPWASSRNWVTKTNFGNSC